MEKFNSTDVFLCLGQKGCGKSYLARKIQSAYPRVVIFDTLQEYDDEDMVFNFHDFSDRLLSYEREKTQNFRLVYQFDPESDAHSAEFNEAMRVLYYRGDVQIVIEECQNFASVHSMPKWLNRAILTGRHQNLSMVFTTQRPGELNKSLLSQCKHVFTGNLFEKNDIEYSRAYLGQDAYTLINLKPREFLYFSPGKQPIKMTNDFGNIDVKSINEEYKPKDESKKDLEISEETTEPLD